MTAALASFRRAVVLAHDLDLVDALLDDLEAVGHVLAHQGDWQVGARLVGGCAAFRDARGDRPAWNAPVDDRWLTGAFDDAPAAAVLREREHGRTLGLDALVALATPRPGEGGAGSSGPP